MRFLVLFTINVLGGSIKGRVSNLRLRPDQTLAQSSSNTFQQKVLCFFMKHLDMNFPLDFCHIYIFPSKLKEEFCGRK